MMIVYGVTKLPAVIDNDGLQAFDTLINAIEKERGKDGNEQGRTDTGTTPEGT